MPRRNFTRNQKEQIVERATRCGVVWCEGCGVALKPGAYEIDHIVPEALRPEADKQEPITIAEGQLLGKACCHRGPGGKTNRDVKQIAKGKRQFDAKHRIAKATRPIPNRPFQQSPKAAKRKEKPALPPVALYATAERRGE